jgi:hypothetical protein
MVQIRAFTGCSEGPYWHDSRMEKDGTATQEKNHQRLKQNWQWSPHFKERPIAVTYSSADDLDAKSNIQLLLEA